MVTAEIRMCCGIPKESSHYQKFSRVAAQQQWYNNDSIHCIKNTMVHQEIRQRFGRIRRILEKCYKARQIQQLQYLVHNTHLIQQTNTSNMIMIRFSKSHYCSFNLGIFFILGSGRMIVISCPCLGSQAQISFEKCQIMRSLRRFKLPAMSNKISPHHSKKY